MQALVSIFRGTPDVPASAALTENVSPEASARPAQNGPEFPPSPEQLEEWRHMGDVRFGVIAAKAAADAAGDPQVDPEMQALFQEEGRLQRLIVEAEQRIRECDARTQKANEPDPQMLVYASCLRESVLAENKMNDVDAIANDLRHQCELTQQAVCNNEELRRVQDAAVRHLHAVATQLAADNASLGVKISETEANLSRNQQHHASKCPVLQAEVSTLREKARNAEADRGIADVEAARLEAEVRWYRLRKGEQVPPA